MDKFRKDVKLRDLANGDFFVTRLTKLSGMVQQRDYSWEAEEKRELKAIDVELLYKGELQRRLLHPDVRVDLVNSLTI